MELSEAIEKCRVDNVFLCEGPRQPQKGSLALIGHHLIFQPDLGNSKKASHEQELWLLHRAVDRVQVEPVSKDLSIRAGAYLRLKCKNFMTCTIEIGDMEDCLAVARSIEKLSNLSGFQHDYPFYYRCPFNVLDNGWTAFGIDEEFARLVILCPDKWRISSVNKNFEVCQSYPELVIVPKGIGDDYLKISATFRDGTKFPILSYYHAETRSCIVRCGQPLIGPTNRRCREDETILNSLLSNVSKGVIFDTRPKNLATSSKGKGGGIESPLYYSQWKYVHGNLPRIKEVHDSLAKLVEACNESINSSTEKWISKLAASNWLQYVADTITGAATVAQCIHCEEVPVVVHGAEGTDSTLLVTSIAQLLLNADARTVRGFECLIEHEWLWGGHPFTLRCAHSAFATGSLTGPYESPVFLLFLDCVWQIMRQYPCSFEFTEEFLIILFEHAYASEFGSFLGNNEKERKDHRVKEHTVSLWSYVNHPEILPSYANALYEPYDSAIWPSVAPQSIVLWERMYLRWQRNWKETDEVRQTLFEWKHREKELQSKLSHLLQRQKSGISPKASPSSMTNNDVPLPGKNAQNTSIANNDASPPSMENVLNKLKLNDQHAQ
uniref:Myotubularin phosphatase domain-containing protein n=1 Tax=Acrobeloides nanus TaxID=290746 RepID=A0A914C300_9BILA